MARSRLEAAANEAGAAFRVVTLEELRGGDLDPGTIVVVDLDELGDRVPTVGARIVGYYSHIDDGVRQRAEAAGIEALPRSRFWRELDRLLGP